MRSDRCARRCLDGSPRARRSGGRNEACSSNELLGLGNELLGSSNERLGLGNERLGLGNELRYKRREGLRKHRGRRCLHRGYLAFTKCATMLR